MQLGLRHVMDDEPVGNLDVAEGVGRGREVGIGRQPPRLIGVQDRHAVIVPQSVMSGALSDDHQRIGLFTPEEITGLVMPQGYKDSIATWLTLHAPAAADSR